MINTNEQTNKLTNIGLKPGTTWSQVEHSTTAAMGKEGVIHKFSSFQMQLVNAKTSMHM